MIEDFYNDLCDIYHIAEETKSPGYSLPSSPAHSYPAQPDIMSLPCHFCVKSQSVAVEQQEPQTVMTARIKLILPAGTDVRLNDRIINKSTGYEYTSELPQNIHGHHIFVYVKRREEQKAL